MTRPVTMYKDVQKLVSELHAVGLDNHDIATAIMRDKTTIDNIEGGRSSGEFAYPYLKQLHTAEMVKAKTNGKILEHKAFTEIVASGQREHVMDVKVRVDQLEQRVDHLARAVGEVDTKVEQIKDKLRGF